MPTSLQALRTAARAKSRAALYAAVAATVLVTTPALAAEPSTPALAAATDSSRVASRTGKGVSPEAQAHRDSAKAAWQAGDLRRAQREFLIAARLLRAAGVLPASEMHSAASIAYGRDRVMDAAYMLDVLAADALAFGRPDVQASALMDAASLYTQAGQRELARERVATLRPLLSSPFVPDSVRTRAVEGGAVVTR